MKGTVVRGEDEMAIKRDKARMQQLRALAAPDLYAGHEDDDEEHPQVVSSKESIDELIDHLAERRRQLSLTQTEVAHLMGTTQPAVAKIETHRLDPSVDTLAMYANAVGILLSFGVTPSDRASTDDAWGRPPMTSDRAPTTRRPNRRTRPGAPRVRP
jgi:transcriptional regulator with XRE-family HTH domain